MAVETRPDAVADVRPSYNPDNYAVRPPAEAEMLSQLRERVAALEVSQKLHDRIPERLTSVEGAIERQGVSIVGHATELSDVGGFHKAIKIALSIIGTILVVLGGVIFFLFGDFVKTSMKMAREYDYCQEHRSDKDGADCIVAPLSVGDKEKVSDEKASTLKKLR